MPARHPQPEEAGGAAAHPRRRARRAPDRPARAGRRRGRTRRLPETGLTFGENALIKAREGVPAHRPADRRRRLRAGRRRAQRHAGRVQRPLGRAGTATTGPTSSWCWPRSATCPTSTAARRSSARPRWCCPDGREHLVDGPAARPAAARPARRRRLRLRPDLPGRRPGPDERRADPGRRRTRSATAARRSARWRELAAKVVARELASPRAARRLSVSETRGRDRSRAGTRRRPPSRAVRRTAVVSVRPSALHPDSCQLQLRVRQVEGGQASGPTSRSIAARRSGPATTARAASSTGARKTSGPGSPAHALDARPAPPGPAGDGVQRRAQLQAADGGEQLDREQAGQVVQHGAQLLGRGPAHRDVVLLHARRSAASRPGRRGEPAVLRDDPGRGVLRDHQPGVDPGVRGQERRQVPRAGHVEQPVDPAFGDRADLGGGDGQEVGGEARAARRGSCRSTRPGRPAAPPGCPRRSAARGRRPWSTKSSVSRAAPATCGAQRIEYASCTACAEVVAVRVHDRPSPAAAGGCSPPRRPAPGAAGSRAAPAGTAGPSRASPRWPAPRSRRPWRTGARASSMASSSMPSMPSVPLISARPSLAASVDRRAARRRAARRRRRPGRRPCRAPSPRRAAPARSGPAAPGRRTRPASRAPAPTA